MYTVYLFGLIPLRLITGEGHPTLITNISLHGGWMHLIGNMLFLQIFGDNIEEVCGHFRYIAFYLTCGAAGSVPWLLTAWGSLQPAAGASGAISIDGSLFQHVSRGPNQNPCPHWLFLATGAFASIYYIDLWFIYRSY